MAGIYVHIPFCKSRCIYCDFYSTTFSERQDDYVRAVLQEFDSRKAYLGSDRIETLYIGGGTPSQLSEHNIETLYDGIMSIADCSNVVESTFECNPDDITPHLARTLSLMGVNRISMGAQSFSDSRLRFLRRRHSADQVRDAVRILREHGIGNISIDLIFGFPNETLEQWKTDISEALRLDVEHISAYSLMYEEGTPLYTMMKKGLIHEIDEEMSRDMYYTLIDILEEAGYEHYEISNFARAGYRSKHNGNYWNGTPYIGLGAGAHSYDRTSRQWNVSDMDEYMDTYIYKVEEGKMCFERETLDEATRYNDMITTALRTREGIDTESMPQFKDFLMYNAQPLIDRGMLAVEGKRLHLTRKGLFLSDDVMSDLIFID